MTLKIGIWEYGYRPRLAEFDSLPEAQWWLKWRGTLLNAAWILPETDDALVGAVARHTRSLRYAETFDAKAEWRSIAEITAHAWDFSRQWFGWAIQWAVGIEPAVVRALGPRLLRHDGSDWLVAKPRGLSVQIVRKGRLVRTVTAPRMRQ